MTTLRQLHEQEQREAALSEARQRFIESMDKIEADHRASVKMFRRHDLIVTAAALLAIVVIWGVVMFALLARP